MKIEEEQLQNNKNHEEEVQLRLKFESKLNLMHSTHRDVITKFKRTQEDLIKEKDRSADLDATLSDKIDEITKLRTTCTE